MKYFIVKNLKRLQLEYSYLNEQVFDRKEYFYNFQQSTELNNQFD